MVGYDDGRNDPTKNHLSNLSPFFHYGHIAPQRVALEITKSSLPVKDKDAFLEEMIVRRELADNFCYYESNYDYFGGFHPWAQKTLNEHRNDEREYLYPEEQFEESETHDPLWNAAQNEMKVKGKMIARKRKIAMRKRAGVDKIKKRANKAARKIIQDKILKDREKDELSYTSRDRLEKMVDKKQPLIKRIAKKLLPSIRKKETERLQKRKGEDE